MDSKGIVQLTTRILGVLLRFNRQRAMSNALPGKPVRLPTFSQLRRDAQRRAIAQSGDAQEPIRSRR